MFVAFFLRVLLLFLASVITLVVCVAGVGSTLALHGVHTVSGWQQAQVAAQWAKSNADLAWGFVRKLWFCEVDSPPAPPPPPGSIVA